MKIQYGITGFVIGIMSGLMLSLLEMRLLGGTGHDTMLLFLMGSTVVSCIVMGVILGVKLAGKKLRK